MLTLKESTIPTAGKHFQEWIHPGPLFQIKEESAQIELSVETHQGKGLHPPSFLPSDTTAWALELVNQRLQKPYWALRIRALPASVLNAENVTSDKDQKAAETQWLWSSFDHRRSFIQFSKKLYSFVSWCIQDSLGILKKAFSYGVKSLKLCMKRPKAKETVLVCLLHRTLMGMV